ncbi:hypothetical protein D3C73_1636680 [compost metagenome]
MPACPVNVNPPAYLLRLPSPIRGKGGQELLRGLVEGFTPWGINTPAGKSRQKQRFDVAPVDPGQC